MVKERIQYFQSFDRATIMYELNEFLKGLPDTNFRIKEIVELPPSGITIRVIYEGIKPDEEMAVDAERRLAEMQGTIKQIETEAESKKEVTDDDLRKMIQDNLSSNSKEGSIWTIEDKKEKTEGENKSG